MMIRYYAPGIPDWPHLYFDDESLVAIVVARYSNWRSMRLGGYAAAVLLLLVSVFSIFLLAQAFSGIELAERVIYVFFAWLAVMGFARWVCRVYFKPAFARSLFAQSTRFATCPDAVAINRQQVDRVVAGQPLSLSLRVTDDPAASRLSQASNLRPEERWDLSQSCRLDLVIAGQSASPLIDSGEFLGGGRVETVAELPTSEAAEQFSTVCSMALTLTATDSPSKAEVPATDIDDEVWS